jgi:PPOX class probable F420-dependent enzyme
MTVALPELARRLADANTFAVLSTINPDGAPQSSVIWIKRIGDDLVFSTIRGRRKTRNMERDPRVSICMFDPEDGYLYVEIRGRVTMTEAGGRELIDELSRRYDGTGFRIEPPEIVRVVCTVTAIKVIEHH